MRPIRSIKNLAEAIESSPVCRDWLECGINSDDLGEGLAWLQGDPMTGIKSGLTRELFMVVTETEVSEDNRLIAKAAHLEKAERVHLNTGGVVFYEIESRRQIGGSNFEASLNAFDKI